MKNTFNEIYEINHLAMKQWNKNRATAEKLGLEKFYKLLSDPLLHPSKRLTNNGKGE